MSIKKSPQTKEIEKTITDVRELWQEIHASSLDGLKKKSLSDRFFKAIIALEKVRVGLCARDSALTTRRQRQRDMQQSWAKLGGEGPCR